MIFILNIIIIIIYIFLLLISTYLATNNANIFINNFEIIFFANFLFIVFKIEKSNFEFISKLILTNNKIFSKLF